MISIRSIVHDHYQPIAKYGANFWCFIYTLILHLLFSLRIVIPIYFSQIPITIANLVSVRVRQSLSFRNLLGHTIYAIRHYTQMPKSSTTSMSQPYSIFYIQGMYNDSLSLIPNEVSSQCHSTRLSADASTTFCPTSVTVVSFSQDQPVSIRFIILLFNNF